MLNSEKMRQPETRSGAGRMGAEIVRNSLFILLAKGFTIGSSLIVLIAAGRYLTVLEYGQYQFILVYVSSVMALAYFGIQQVVIREIARSKADAAIHIGAALQLRTLLSAVAVAVLLVSMNVMKLSHLDVFGMMLAIVSEFFLSMSMLSRAVFQAYEKMFYDPLVSSIYSVLLLAGVAVAIAFDLGFPGLLAAAAIANAVQFAAAARILTSRFARPSFTFRKGMFLSYLKDAAVIGLGVFFYQNLFKVNALMIKWFGNIEDVAYFQIPHNLVLQIQILPFAVVTAVFPVFSRLLREDLAMMRETYERIFRYLFLFSLFISVFTFGFAREIIGVMFGSKYAPSASALMIVAWAIVPLCLDMLLNAVLIAMDKQRYAVLYAGITLLFNILLAAVLVPSYGYLAASFISLASYLLLLLFSAVFVSKNGLGIFRSAMVSRILLAGIGGVAAIYFLKPVHPALAFVTAAGFYFGGLFKMGIFKAEESTLLKGLAGALLGKARGRT